MYKSVGRLFDVNLDVQHVHPPNQTTDRVLHESDLKEERAGKHS